nr:OB-fold nucleic acid binding domain-containing protein [Draconibacterium orientale]
MPEFLDQEIKFLPGVGPKRAEILFKELKIKTFRDLIYYYPYKYIDRTKFYNISDINTEMAYIQVKGVLRSMETVGTGSKQRLVARFSDSTGTMELVWFRGIKWQKEQLRINKTYIVFGKPALFSGRISVVHPEMETEQEMQLKPIGLFQGHYNTTEKMKKQFLTSKTINKFQLTLLGLAKGKIRETLPEYITSELKLMPLEQALSAIHKPENQLSLKTPPSA